MLLRFCFFLPLCLLAATVNAHVNGHAHPGEPKHSHAAVDQLDQKPPQYQVSDLRPDTASLEEDASVAPASIQRLEAGQQDLQKAMQRLHQDIAALRAAQARPGPTEIIGGIGYIVGLLGLYAWFRARRRFHASR